MRSLVLLMICGVLSGCVALHTEGVTSASDHLARVSGDYRIRAGAPVSVYLRSVDEHLLKFWQSAVDVEGGSHRLLVDCMVSASNQLSRHELNVTLNAGGHYKLRAEATPQQGCTQVTLEAID